MSKPLRRTASKPQLPSHDEEKRAIAAQVEDFLKLGGAIQHIPNGVSGQTWTPVKAVGEPTQKKK